VKTEVVQNCLVCGRCREVCPVGINTDNLRLSQRKVLNNSTINNYNYLTSEVTQKTDVIYFAGCMTHLTPTIKKSMLYIFESAKINFQFLDADGSVCCGRPLALAGREEEAQKLIDINKKSIVESGAKLLVTSCPICYRVFKQEYNLDIEVFHHSEYLNNLVKSGKLTVNKSKTRVIYHDPCDLGRGTGVYLQPRELLDSFTNLQHIKNENSKSLCCGGSLGNFQINAKQRNSITQDVVNQLTINQPEVIVTSCPLCKKTLAPHTKVEVKDIAEILAKAIKASKLENNKVSDKLPQTAI
jgi:Fe-S oxidoreductase